jgi:hypothetical protein
MISNDGIGWQMEHFLLLLGNISNLECVFVIPGIGCSGLDVFVFRQLCLYCGYVNTEMTQAVAGLYHVLLKTWYCWPWVCRGCPN